jgi:hypothetical protein
MKRRLVLLGTLAVLGAASPAAATTGYGSVSSGSSSGSGPVSPQHGGSLPYTGLDLELVAGGGLGLLGLGLALRRGVRRQGD